VDIEEENIDSFNGIIKEEVVDVVSNGVGNLEQKKVIEEQNLITLLLSNLL